MKRTDVLPDEQGDLGVLDSSTNTDGQDVPAETSCFRPIAPVDDDGRTHLRESLLLLDEEGQVVAFSASPVECEKASEAVLLEEVRVEREARREACHGATGTLRWEPRLEELPRRAHLRSAMNERIAWTRYGWT